jgi:hypothetical protein
MTQVCPTCGQEVLTRHGVMLQRKKADILDAIEKYTKHDGITIERLAWLIYPGTPRPTAIQRLTVHIGQINDLLAATDWRVVNRDGLYRCAKGEAA